MKKLLARAKTVAKNPTVRPLEVWAIRAAIVYVAAKLGLSLHDLAR